MTDELNSPPRRDWFSVERRVFDDPMFACEPYSKRDAWLWLIAKAAKRDHHVQTRGGIIELKRGEVIVAREYLASTWRWTPSRVRTFLAQLCDASRLKIDQSNGHRPNVAKVSKYNEFQSGVGGGAPVEAPVDRQSVASGSPHTYKEQGTVDRKRERASHSARPDRAIIDGALADYNRAAEQLRFAPCTTLSDQRAKALAKRLADIGGGDLNRGADRFRDALGAIPHDRFLAGKAPPRAGSKPFRLDLDRLLSTGSRMGDVLAKLLDLHDEHGPATIESTAAPRREADVLAAQWREAQAEELAAQRARFDGGDDAVH